MSQHYVIVADQGHLRFFQQTQEPEQMRPGLREVEALDFPLGVKSYVAEESDMSGRFQGSKHQGTAPGAPGARTGMSIDERLPMRREMDRRRNGDVGGAIDQFLRRESAATWDFAAPSELHAAFLDAISPEVRARLRRLVTKDLVHQPSSAILGHFAAEGPGRGR